MTVAKKLSPFCPDLDRVSPPGMSLLFGYISNHSPWGQSPYCIYIPFIELYTCFARVKNPLASLASFLKLKSILKNFGHKNIENFFIALHIKTRANNRFVKRNK